MDSVERIEKTETYAFMQYVNEKKVYINNEQRRVSENFSVARFTNSLFTLFWFNILEITQEYLTFVAFFDGKSRGFIIY